MQKKGREKRGQVSTEYLVIIGFVLIVLVPVTIIYIRYTGSTQDVVGGAKTSYLASEIVKAANEVYAYGQDSQKKIKLNFPDGIESVAFQGKEIVFKFKDSKGRISEIVEVADVSFRNTFVPVTPGQKDLIIRSLGVSVAVTIACNMNPPETKAGDATMCNALCTPPRSSCTLVCVNKAWTAQSCA